MQRENCIHSAIRQDCSGGTWSNDRPNKKIDYRISVSIVRHHCLCLIWSYFWRDFSINTIPQRPLQFTISFACGSCFKHSGAWLKHSGVRLNMDQGHLIDNWMVKFVFSCCVVSKQVEVSTILVPVEWPLASLIPSPPPQLSSLTVWITWRKPGKNYHEMYVTVTSQMLVSEFCSLIPRWTISWERDWN